MEQLCQEKKKNQITKVLKYWRSSLVSEEKLKSTSKVNPGDQIFCEQEILIKGILSQEIVQKITKKISELNKYQKSDKFRAKGQELDLKKLDAASNLQKQDVDLWIAPIVIGSSVISSYQQASIYVPYWIQVKMSQDGRLSPGDGFCKPMIDRRYFERQNEDEDLPYCGPLEDFEKIIETLVQQVKGKEFQEDDGSMSWSSYIGLFQNLLKNNTDCENAFEQSLQEQGFRVYSKPLVSLPPEEILQKQYLLRFYDDLLDTKNNVKYSPLLEQVTHQYQKIKIERSSVTDEIIREASYKHLGHIGWKHSLAPSQRQALSEYLNSEKSSIFAVNGPPGTGKTTFLHSLMAQEFVKSALLEKERPPLIVATSSNNRAVANIIDSLGKVLVGAKDVLSSRWLPDLHSYGLYLRKPPAPSEEDLGSYLYCHSGFSETNYSLFHSNEYYDRAIPYFFKKASEYFLQNFRNFQEARSMILNEMREKVRELCREQEYVDNFCERWPAILEKNLSLQKIIKMRKDLFEKLQEDLPEDLRQEIYHQHEKIIVFQNEFQMAQKEWDFFQRDWTDKIDISEILFRGVDSRVHSYFDRYYRSSLFFLATHYWESVWLEDFFKQDVRSNSLLYQQKVYGYYSMLTPCMVTTMFMGPTYFGFQGKNPKIIQPMIDLLIVDEAGMVLPTVAAPMLSLAHKAVVVGDTKQLGPIRNISSIEDRDCLEKFDLWNENQGLRSLEWSGICASSGNLMRIAQSCNPILEKESSVGGVFLREHYRCHEDIISYSNEICYRNLLMPMKIATDFPFPRMGYMHIKGRSVKKGKSRINRSEAVTLVRWIFDNQHKILEACQKLDPDRYPELSDCLGIVTPFRAQADLIKEMLKEFSIKLDRVGTVHVLQGAERPMILFSPVLVRGAQQNQIEDSMLNKAELLNVAVSRAQESFLFFGDMDILNTEDKTSSIGILGRHLLKKEESEIHHISQYQILDTPSIEQIRTLERHRNLLKNAIQKSNHEVNIVSPFLSKYAIDADNICDLIAKRKSQSSISIRIFTDPWMNKNAGRKDYEECIQALCSSGAEVYEVKSMHSKILSVDRSLITFGSFNWLSASRQEGPFLCQEDTLLFQGPLASENIQMTFKDLIQRGKLRRS